MPTTETTPRRRYARISEAAEYLNVNERTIRDMIADGRITAPPYAPRMRDIATIDSELRLLVAIRRMVREAEGRTPNARRIDQLLDERAAAERKGR